MSNVTVPAPRAARSPIATGSSWRSASPPTTSSADPYLIKNPVTASRQLSPLLGKPPLTVLQLLTKPHTGFVYLAHLVPAAQAATRSPKLRHRRDHADPETNRVYPRVDGAASQVRRDGRLGRPRAPAASSTATTACCAARNGDRAGSSTTRSASRSRSTTCARRCPARRWS